MRRTISAAAYGSSIVKMTSVFYHFATVLKETCAAPGPRQGLGTSSPFQLSNEVEMFGTCGWPGEDKNKLQFVLLISVNSNIFSENQIDLFLLLLSVKTRWMQQKEYKLDPKHFDLVFLFEMVRNWSTQLCEGLRS